jgi:hypothetical protein
VTKAEARGYQQAIAALRDMADRHDEQMLRTWGGSAVPNVVTTVLRDAADGLERMAARPITPTAA